MNTKSSVFGLNLDGTPDSQDNGIGFMGADTRDPSLIGFSLPVAEFVAKYGGVSQGKKTIQQYGPPTLEVTNTRTGLSTQGPLVDLGPGKGPVSRGVGLDSTYGAAKAIGLTGMDPVSYRFVTTPGLDGAPQTHAVATDHTPGAQPFSPGAGEMVIPLPQEGSAIPAPQQNVQAPEFGQPQEDASGFSLPAQYQGQIAGQPQAALPPQDGLSPSLTAPAPVPQNMVNPTTGQQIPVTASQAAVTRASGPSRLQSIGASAAASQSAIVGGKNPGEVLAKGLPQLLNTWLNPEARDKTLVGQLFKPGEDGRSAVGGFADTIKNVFSGFNTDRSVTGSVAKDGAGLGNGSTASTSMPAPSYDASVADVGNSNLSSGAGVNLASSSGNDSVKFGYDYLKSFFSGNDSVSTA